MPRSPWLASAAWTKNAGWPVEASVAAILRATWPDLPRPVTITRPGAAAIVSTARRKAGAEPILAGRPQRLGHRCKSLLLNGNRAQRGGDGVDGGGGHARS